jgi:hypothetical protein
VFNTTDRSDSPLIRCAAHSARSSEHGMPHTFSVYVRKKVRNNRRPNRFVTHSSKVSSFGRGNSCRRT